MPHPIVFQKIAQKVPDSFEFTVKAHKSMTHERKDDKPFLEFSEAIKPLQETGKLGAVLAQFPWGFKYTRQNLEYLSFFKERMHTIPLVIEFRNNGWLNDTALTFMKDIDLNFSCVDEPHIKGLLPPTDTVTGNIGYVRFHSRNKDTWWGTSVEKRYDYLYSKAELEEWAPRIKNIVKKTTKTYIFFNNCHHGKAAVNAQMMKDILMLV
ncbi:DUF72 domain-containing protein [Chlamydiota bacterium]